MISSCLKTSGVRPIATAIRNNCSTRYPFKSLAIASNLPYYPTTGYRDKTTAGLSTVRSLSNHPVAKKLGLEDDTSRVTPALLKSVSVQQFSSTPEIPSHALKPEWTMPLKEGDRVPDVVFLTRVRIESDAANPFEWKVLRTSDLFAGKKVVLFALPGAFTPTCSSTHLPGYEKAYDEMKKLGVDEVYCLSVNDAFVMRQWGLHQGLEEDKTLGSLGFKKVKLIPDGACAFTRGMGMSCVWDSKRGFGERSWRYSMVAKDGVIEKMFVEQPKVQNSGPDPFEVSDAETMLAYLKTKSKA